MRARRLVLLSLPVIFLAGSCIATTAHAGDITSAMRFSACPPAKYGVNFESPKIASGAKTVALTFDDGPGYDAEQIMSILKSYGIRGTFLNNANTHFDTLKSMFAQGFLLGSHTASHHMMNGAPWATQESEFTRLIRWQQGQTGSTPCVFRPPYGAYDGNTVQLAYNKNETFYIWNAGTGDWMAQGSGTSYWINYIASSATNLSLRTHNANILLHDQLRHMPATVAALPIMIKRLKAHGYVFIDLLGRTGPPGVCGPASAPTPEASARTLASDATLTSGDSLTSPNGQFTLTMQSNGNLVWRITDGRTLWSSRTAGHSGAEATMGSDGVLRVHDGSGTLWSSSNSGTSGDTLSIQSNGQLAVGTSWTSRTLYTAILPGDELHSGWYVSSENRRCRTTMGTSGNLAVTDATGQVLYDNKVSLGKDAVTKLLASGEFVTRSSSGTLGFTTWTSGRPHDYVTVTNSGRLAVIGVSTKTLWSTQ